LQERPLLSWSRTRGSRHGERARIVGWRIPVWWLRSRAGARARRGTGAGSHAARPAAAPHQSHRCNGATDAPDSGARPWTCRARRRRGRGRGRGRRKRRRRGRHRHRHRTSSRVLRLPPDRAPRPATLQCAARRRLIRGAEDIPALWEEPRRTEVHRGGGGRGLRAWCWAQQRPMCRAERSPVSRHLRRLPR
jgi:hypothetical protein